MTVRHIMKSNKGFTLIELLIAIAVLGVIAAIAIPNYMESVHASKRVEAGNALTQFSQAMQRLYTINNSFQGAAAGGNNTGAPAATTFSHTQSPSNGDASYTLTISAATETTFTLSAVPTGGQSGDKCGTLTLSSAGARGDALGGSDACWK